MKYRRRPLVLVLIFFVLGILIAHTWECRLPWLTGFTTLMLALNIVSLFTQRLQLLRTLLVLSTCTALGALLYTNARFPAERLYEHTEKIQHVQGTVVSYPDHGPQRSRFVLKPKTLWGISKSSTITPVTLNIFRFTTVMS